MTDQYVDQLLCRLGDPSAFKGDERGAVRHYVHVFRRSFRPDATLCFGAIPGAESGHLPKKVTNSTRVFFERNLEWLQVALASSPLAAATSGGKAKHILATVEGALVVSKSLNDETLFDQIVAEL